MRRILASLCLCLLMSCAARADLLVYFLPSGATWELQGEATVSTSETVTFKHPEFGTMYFGFNDVKFFKAPSTLSVSKKKLAKAKDVESCLEAARWSLHHGLLGEFNKAAAAAWTLDKNNPTVQRLARLKRKIGVPLPLGSDQEGHVRKYVTTTNDLEVSQSTHYLLLHNTSPKDPTSGRGKVRKKGVKTSAEQRLDLLEMVFESFLMKFYLEGLEVEFPKQRLMVVLFADRSDYDSLVNATTKGAMSKSAGYYDKVSNIAVFYDQGTGKEFESLTQADQVLQERAKEAMRVRGPTAKDVIRLSKTLHVVCEMAKKNQDIEVVSHEATHQMAANTNLQPNDSGTPIWVAEGIATYFESPKEAAWAGIGTVNESRLEGFRRVANDKIRSSVDFVASDMVFMGAKTHEDTLYAYSEAWAFTHFLMAKHFDKLMKYYDALAKRKSKGMKLFMPPENLKLFKKYFGEDTQTLNAEWHAYMQSLKTDSERIMEGE